MKNILAKAHALLSWFIKIINNARKVPHRNDSNSGDSATSVASVSPAIECYACTQPGVPTFHSTTCDRAHSPEWAASAGSSLIPIQPNASSGNLLPIKPKERKKRRRGQWVLDPRSPRVQHWNRGLLLARAVALALDPIFFYSLSVGGGNAPACLYMDGNLVAAVAVMRTMADLAHIAHMLLQLRLAYVSRESLVVGCGKLVWDARMVAEHYLRSVKGFWFDLFVILPVPQVAFFMVIPKLVQDQDIKLIMTILLLIFFFQFLPKVFHIFCVMRRMQKVTGFIFGSIWWGFGLNLIAYFIASHVAGGCWYVLTIQRIASCLKQQCEKNNSCNLRPPACLDQVCYHLPLSSSCQNFTAAADMICLKLKGPFRYGIYGTALPIVSSNSLAVKILYPIFWGLMTLRCEHSRFRLCISSPCALPRQQREEAATHGCRRCNLSGADNSSTTLPLSFSQPDSKGGGGRCINCIGFFRACNKKGVTLHINRILSRLHSYALSPDYCLHFQLSAARHKQGV